MNRILLLLSAFLLTLPFSMQAQIILDAEDAPAIGDEFIYASDTTVADLTPGAAGADQLWAFTGLDVHSLDTSVVVDPMDVDGHENFPEATAALETMGVTAFLQLTATELLNIGAIGGVLGFDQNFVIRFDPPQKVLEIPTTFGTTFVDNYRLVVQVAGEDLGQPDFDSLRFTSNVTNQVEVDAWGALEVDGESYDVLRQHTVSTSLDTLEFQLFGNWIPISTTSSTSENYQWLSEDAKGPVFTLDYAETGGTPTSATYLAPNVMVEAPAAAFSYEDLGSGTVTFTDESTNAPAAWEWNFDDGNTSTEQNPEHTFSEDGTYNVCLTVSNAGGSNQTCQEVQIIITSTGEPAAADLLTVGPNPASDRLQFQLDGYHDQPLRLTVVNTNGQAVYRRDLRGDLTVNTSQWTPGFYVYVLQDSKSRILKAGKVEIAR